MPYTADATNTATPADGDYIVNGPAELRAIKLALAAVVASTANFLQELYVTTATTLTTAQNGLTVLLISGVLTLPAPIISTQFRIVGTGAATGSFKVPSGLIIYPDGNTIAANTPTSVIFGTSFDIIADGTNWLITSMAGDVIVKTSTLGNRPARIDQVIGMLQTWQDLTASRVVGTTYYNSTGRPIMVAVCYGPYVGSGSSPPGVQLTGSVDGISFVWGSAGVWSGSADQPSNSISLIIPNGSSYKFSNATKWLELR